MTVCLNMIVKNEAKIIERCLASILSLIDYWVIVDTGSSDGTQEGIRTYMQAKGVPGELHERPWLNFEHNRNEALHLAKGKAEYAMFLDADEVAVCASEYRFPKLTEDSYNVVRKPRGIDFTFDRTLLVRQSLPWRWAGVLHEAVICDQAVRPALRLDNLIIEYAQDSERGQDPNKFVKDAEILEEALKMEPQNARYMFYLAQSYKDSWQNEKAIQTYQRRVAMGGWAEEVWYSLYQIGALHIRNKAPRAVILDSCLQAYQYRPCRAEPLHLLCTYCREHEEWALGHMFAVQASKVKRPNDVLFIEDAVYNWKILDELSIAAYYSGAYQEALAANDALLLSKYDPSQHKRLIANRNFSVDALRKMFG